MGRCRIKFAEGRVRGQVTDRRTIHSHRRAAARRARDPRPKLTPRPHPSTLPPQQSMWVELEDVNQARAAARIERIPRRRGSARRPTSERQPGNDADRARAVHRGPGSDPGPQCPAPDAAPRQRAAPPARVPAVAARRLG